MTSVFNDIDGSAAFGDVNAIGGGEDLAIVTYGNGTYLSQRAASALKDKGVNARIIDLRWLTPLPMDSLVEAIGARKNVLIVDECRKSGSPSEEIIAQFVDRGLSYNLSRITGADTFIPLGPAANEVLISETDIVNAALALTGKSAKRAAE
jgi:2-oxoisovalerate dehydrogenase E1 component